NSGRDGTAATVTGLPSPTGPPLDNLPSDCADSPSVGAKNGQVGELLTCSTVPFGDPSLPVVRHTAKAIAIRVRLALAAVAVGVARRAAGCGGGTNTQPQVDVGPQRG